MKALLISYKTKLNKGSQSTIKSIYFLKEKGFLGLTIWNHLKFFGNTFFGRKPKGISNLISESSK